MVSVVLVLASAIFQTKTVHSWEELQGIKFGFPVPFVVQDQNYNPPLPYDASFVTIQEHGTTILLPWFFVDVFLIFSAIALVGTVLLNTVLKPRRKVILKWFLVLGYGSLALLLTISMLSVLAFIYLLLANT